MKTAVSSKSTQPLHQIRVAITRSEEQAKAQRTLLEGYGAEVFEYPCIKIVGPRQTAQLDAALDALFQQRYEWLIVTSTNSVEALSNRAKSLNLPSTLLHSVKVAAVGPKTAQKVKEHFGVDVATLPDEYTAARLAETLELASGTRVLLPQSAIAKSTLADFLREKGIAVEQVEAYRTVIALGGDPVPAMLWEGKIDAITFTSESTVRFFNKRLSYERGTLAMLDHVCVACIGPVTAAAAEALGLTVSVEPEDHTLEGLTDGLIKFFAL